MFGILVGTLGVGGSRLPEIFSYRMRLTLRTEASYLPLISHIRSILRKAHKKFYTISVGKINPAKLANFMEIECWVWVSCSEGMVDSKASKQKCVTQICNSMFAWFHKDYFKPIITPFELEVVLQKDPEWSGKYTFDFNELLENLPSVEGRS